MRHGTVRSLAVAAVAGVVAAACGSRGADELPAELLQSAVTALGEDSVVTLASGDTVRLSSHTAAFYEGRAYAAAWVDSRRLGEQGRAVYEALSRSDEDGLPPQQYRHDVAAALLSALEPERRSDRLPDSVAVRYLADLDLLLTEGFGRYARDLVAGTLDPTEAGLDWRIQGEVADAGAVLNNAAGGRDPGEIVEHLRPSIPYYERMRTALAAYRAAADRGGWSVIPEGATLREGERNEAVVLLRRRFLSGMDPREAELAQVGAGDSTLFDASLKEAVQHFQQRHSIEADGAVGAATLRELNHTVEDRIAEMRLNLDRWRWLPNELGERFVIVNIAGFELELVDGGRAIESMNVVVGRLERATPIFADSIQHVVVNPYWNVPDGIYRNDVVPAMERDPQYLVRNDMEFVDGRVRQRPGPRNSLGRYKFLFPNEFDVYLHDTPEGQLFSRVNRDFSSGCIRLERPEDFARLLLDLQTDDGASQLDPLLTHWNESWIKLDRTLPVYLLYFTAWVDENGTVRFHHDVYGRDGKLETQAEDRLQAPDEPPRIALRPQG
ncbi:MAG TPA: L,D-transpeptidase family protein [Longimicrobiales bacterium]|nr:L,D-transpeptidase family protein [Longimicrobiales bacterium]